MADRLRVHDTPLALRIDNVGPIPARDLADLLTSIDAAFSTYASDRGSGQLSVEVRSGSIEILFEVAEQMWGAKELLAPFAVHLIDVTRLLAGYGRLAETSNEDLKAASAAAKLVADGNATNVHITNYGTVNVTINEGNAKQIRREAKRRKKKPTRPPRIPDVAAVSALASGSLMGTALMIDGQWYARLLDGEGVLVPLSGDKGAISSLRHDRQFRFEGEAILGSKRQFVGARIYAARPIP